MAGITQTAQEKFTSLRKRLDQLGYKQPLGLDCLPLVERLFCDLVWTTESLRKTKLELNSQLKLRSAVEDYVAPYKTDNGRLVKENNELHRQLLNTRQDHEDKLRDLRTEYRKLNGENEDLKLFNSQCLEKIRSYEETANRMAEQILLLQEKNFQAVVYTPGGRKKQLPFRRQRMDIDYLVPKSVPPKGDDNYCCTVAKHWDKLERARHPETLNLLDLTTKRCDDLEQQVTQLEQELELSDRKVENFRNQVALRDAEIERLRAVSERGRPLEALLQDTTDRQADRLIQQLQMQVDLLQSRNEELESHMIEFMSREARKIPDSLSPEVEHITKAVQTSQSSSDDKVNSACQTEVIGVACPPKENNHTETNQFAQIRTALREIEEGRGYLMKRIDILAARERELINELSTKVGSVKPSRRGGKESPPKSLLNQAVEKRLRGLEADRQRWRFEAKKALHALHQLTRLPRTRSVSNHVDLRGSAGPHYHVLCNAPCINARDLRAMGSHRRSVTPPARHLPRSDTRQRSASMDLSSVQAESLDAQLRNVQEERDHYRYMWEEAKYCIQRQRSGKCHSMTVPRAEKHQDKCSVPCIEELNRMRADRDSLLSLLNKFERQLIEIQSNVRVLTEERDLLSEQLNQARSELKDTRDQLAFSAHRLSAGAPNRDLRPSSAERNGSNRSGDSQSRVLLQRLSCDRDHLADLLHQMTVERDSLRDRLHALTEQGLSEKARLLQRLEESEEELRALEQTRNAESLTHADLTKRINLLEAERRQLLDRVDYLSSCLADDAKLVLAQRNLQTVQSRLDQVEQEYQALRDESTQMRRDLKQLDHEKDNLQTALDERTEQCAMLEREMFKRDRQVHQFQHSTQTFEQRVLRLTESAAQRDEQYRQLSERAALLELELNQTIEARDRVTRESEQAKTDLNTMMQEAQNLKSQLRCETNKVLDLQNRLDAAYSEQAKLRDLNSCADSERVDLLKQYRALTLESDEKTARIAQIENQLGDSQHLCTMKDKEISSCKTQMNTLHKDLAEYQQVVQTLESQCALLNQTVSESEGRVRRLQCENEENCRELTEVRALCDRLERQSHQTHHQLTTNSLETEQLRAQLTEAERELARLRKQIDHERDTVRNLEAILNTSRDGEIKAQKEAQRYRHELQLLRERFDQRNNRLSEVEREIYELRGRAPVNGRSGTDAVRPTDRLFSTESQLDGQDEQNNPQFVDRCGNIVTQQSACPPIVHQVRRNNWTGVLDVAAPNFTVLNTSEAQSSAVVSQSQTIPLMQAASDLMIGEANAPAVEMQPSEPPSAPVLLNQAASNKVSKCDNFIQCAHGCYHHPDCFRGHERVLSLPDGDRRTPLGGRCRHACIHSTVHNRPDRWISRVVVRISLNQLKLCCRPSADASHPMWVARPTNRTVLMESTDSENTLQRSSSKASIATESSITIDCSVNTIPVIPSSPIIELSIRSSQPTLVDDSGRPGSLYTCSELTLPPTESQSVM
ncbi:Centrosomal protein of 135 kDa [Fasciola hepatica]|uniref:Centrosomal protein of 135 kDa n=1 Tax=Fasciola hepatica TaxID=6192 RepID=A0A4E0RFI9_FASHE|nr:Centrosomal protein of 135 kDa [Fasciola hepatica]